MRRELKAAVLVLSLGWVPSNVLETASAASAGATGVPQEPANEQLPGGASCGGQDLGLARGRVISVKRLLGLRVSNPLGEDVGHIADVNIDRHGCAVSAVLRVGGFMGMGGRDVPMPLAKFHIGFAAPAGNLTATVFDTREHILHSYRSVRSPD